MLNYLFRRLSLLFTTGFVLTIIAFIVTYLSESEHVANSNYFLDYFHYVYSIFHGDWGFSSIDHQSILRKGLFAFSSTIELCFLAFIFATIISLPLGIIAALYLNRMFDYIIMGLMIIGLAVPAFWLAVIVKMSPDLFTPLFSTATDIELFITSPHPSGFLVIDSIFNKSAYTLSIIGNRLMNLFLASGVLAVFLTSEMTRLTRHSIAEIMKSNYVKASYAKGLSSKQIVIHHVLKNALPPIIHQIRLQLSTIISFAMVIEIVFSIHGTGSWLLTSIKAGDYLALPTAVLLISGFILITSIFIDILLVVISPVKRKSLYAD